MVALVYIPAALRNSPSLNRSFAALICCSAAVCFSAGTVTASSMVGAAAVGGALVGRASPGAVAGAAVAVGLGWRRRGGILLWRSVR